MRQYASQGQANVPDTDQCIRSVGLPDSSKPTHVCKTEKKYVFLKVWVFFTEIFTCENPEAETDDRKMLARLKCQKERYSKMKIHPKIILFVEYSTRE